MKVETKKLDATKMQLDIEVPPEAVKKKFDDVYEEIGKEAKIPGFRPGKAPRDVLEKHHSRLAQEEVIKNLIPEVYQDSLEKEGLNAVELPQISDVKLDSNVLSFKAVVEIMPKIEVSDYKNIKLKTKKVVVTQDEIDKAVGQLKEAHKVDQLDDKFAKGFGYRDIEQLRSSIERQLFMQKENDQKYHQQEDLVKQIIDKVNFTIPQSLVNRRLEELVRQAKSQMLSRGMPKEQVDAKEQDLRKELLKDASVQVKSFLVLEEIARKENIPRDDHTTGKVIEFLLREAQWPEEKDS